MKFCAPSLDVRHGFYTRLGGVSRGVYRSLNAAYHTGDQPENVNINRQRIIHDLADRSLPVLTSTQVHGCEILNVTWDNADRVMDTQADALITSTPGLAIGVLTADCVPILLYDPVVHMVGAVHAGWRGAAGGIIEKSVNQMVLMGANLCRLHAAIGPCIHAESYEVQKDFCETIRQMDPSTASFLLDDQHFDLQGYVHQSLISAGIKSIFDVQQNTYDEPQWWFSHRRSQHKGDIQSGRQLSVIMVD